MQPLRTVPTFLWRSLTRACPNCGARGVHRNYWKYLERCPSCQIHLERGEHGYVVGTYMFNLVASELIFVAVMITWITRTWGHVAWDLVQYVGVAMMVLLPVVFYPVAKGLFLSFHLFWHPQGDTDR